MGAGATSSYIIAEAPASYKQAVHAAAAGKYGRPLSKWLESSGVLLKIACLSDKASDLTHSFRVARDWAAASRSKIALISYGRVRDDLVEVVRDRKANASEELVDAFEAEVHRSNGFIDELTVMGKRKARPSGLDLIDLTAEHSQLLRSWSTRLSSPQANPDTAIAYNKFMSTVPPHDPGWAAIAEIALDRAGRVLAEYPRLTRANLAATPAAKSLVEKSYRWHGKGEMFEHYGKRFGETADAVNGSLRAATQRAAARGPEWTADMTVGELRLWLPNAGSSGWKKFADQGVLIVPKVPATTSARQAGAIAISGSAQPQALIQFKAEARQSRLPAQQTKDLVRVLDTWAAGDPVYMAAHFYDENGEIVERVFALEPPDPKAGLEFFGVGTSNARIAERKALAARGALVTNIKCDISNEEMRFLWDELFWVAFESL